MSVDVEGLRLAGRDAIRILMMVGFELRGSSDGVASMHRGGCTLFVPVHAELGGIVLGVLLRDAGIVPEHVGALLARLRVRDTLPDLGESAT